MNTKILILIIILVLTIGLVRFTHGQEILDGTSTERLSNQIIFEPLVLDSSSLTTDLISYWTLDENSSPNVDSVGSNNLTNTGSPTTGKINNGVDLTSTSDYLTPSSAADFNFTGSEAFSISLWIKIHSLENNGPIFAHQNLGSTWAGYKLITKPDGHLEFNMLNQDANGVVLSTPVGTLTTDTWYNIVVTKDSPATASSYHIYVNNVDQSLTTVSDNFSGTAEVSASFMLGNWEGSYTVNGIIDEAGVWARELTTDEIANLYNSGTGISYPFESTPEATTTPTTTDQLTSTSTLIALGNIQFGLGIIITLMLITYTSWLFNKFEGKKINSWDN